MKNKNSITFFIMLLVSLGQFAIDIYLPSFPAMMKDFQTTQSSIQLTLTFFLAGLAFSQLIYGPLSDRFGRRKILMLGLSIFILTSAGAVLVHSINGLIIMRLMQGLGIGAANVLCRAILRDLYEGKELAKKVSLLGILWVTSPIIAPVIGGYIETYLGWRTNFVFLALFVACMWVWALFFLHETKDPSELHSIHPRHIIKNYAQLLASRPFVGYVLANFFLYGIFSAFYVAGPFLLQDVLGLSPIVFGWIMLIISTGYLIGVLLNIRLLSYFEVQNIIQAGSLLIIVISAAMTLIAWAGFFNPLSIALPMTLLLFAVALMFTNCIGKSLSIFPTIAGTASGLWGFIAYLGGIVATAVMTRLPTDNPLPLSAFLCGLCLLTFLALIWGKPKVKHS